MGSLTRFGMTLMVESASMYDLELGLNAARKILDRAGVSPRDAWGATVEMESHCQARLDGKADLSVRTQENAALWVMAFDEALAACCGGGVAPPGADLSPAS